MRERYLTVEAALRAVSAANGPGQSSSSIDWASGPFCPWLICIRTRCVHSCGTTCRVVLARVFTRSFSVRAIATQLFWFVGARSVGTLSCLVVGAATLLLVRGAPADGIASTHNELKAAR